MTRQPFRLTSFTAALALAAGAAAASAQAGEALEDGRWLPYLGCWVDVEAAAGPMTCVVPEGPGVALLTVTGSVITDRRVLRADGADRPAEVTGCTGTEAAEFSADGRRVYTRARLTCSGDLERLTRGLMAMVEADQWIEARTVGVDGGSVAWVKRYGPAPAARVEAAGLADRPGAAVPQHVMEAARVVAAGAVTVDHIIEAYQRTDAEAVKAWIAEQDRPIRLDADRLVRLADAGVPAEVIDVAVAVSFPDRFAVAREPRDRAYDHSFGPYHMYDPFYYRYSGYYGYYGFHDRGFYGPGYIRYRPTVIVVSPSEPMSGGRVVRGQGYRGSAGGEATARPRSTRIGSPSTSRVGTGQRGAASGGSKGKAKPRGGL